MTKEYVEHLDPKVRKAVADLQQVITKEYPTATFAVSPGEENPESTYITTTVDIDDPDEVVDLVIDRLLELQIDQGMHLHVVPIRSSERIKATRQAESRNKAAP